MNFLNKGNECFVYWVVRKMVWIFFICINMFIWGKCSVDFRVYVNLVSLIIIFWVIGEINFLLVGNNSIIYRVGWFSFCIIIIVNKVFIWCEECISFFRGIIGVFWDLVVFKYRVIVFMNFFIVKIVCLMFCMFYI